MLVPAGVLVGLAASASAEQIFHEPLSPFRGPYGPPRHQRQYHGAGSSAPFPLASGSASASSGSRPTPQESGSLGSPPPTAVGPATAVALTTGSTSLFSYDPVSNTSSSHVSFVHAPSGSAPTPHVSRRPRPSNGTCTGKTVNVLNASLDWWYTETYTQTDSTFLVQFNDNETATGWTLVPSQTSFNVTSAIAKPTCNSVTAFNEAANSTMLSYSCWDTPTPVAAVTTTVEQTAYKPINATTANGTIPNVGVSPTPASLTVGASNVTNQTYTSGAPIVHFSKYEVVTKRPSRYPNGRVECIESTRVYNLSKAQSFEFQGDANDQQAADEGVVGDIHFGLLRALRIADATPGSFVAEPTVVVVVQKVLAAAAVLPASTEIAASSLQTPTPTLPPYIETARDTPTDPGQIWVPLTAHVESSDTALDVPTKTARPPPPPPPPPNGDDNRVTTKANIVTSNFVAQHGGSSMTVAIPVESGGHSVVTAVVNGDTVTATLLPQTGGSDGGNIGLILTAIGNANKPTNAEQVLSQAELTFHNGGNGDPAASVMASIIGAVPLPSPGGSGTENGNGPGGQHGQSPGGESGSGGQSPSNENGNEQNSGDDPGGQNSGSGSGSGFGSGSDSGSGAGAGPFEQHPVFHIGSHDFTGSAVQGHTPPAFVIDGQTAVAGEAPITVDGTRVSIAPGATAVAIGDSTSPIGVAAENPGLFANIPFITVGSKTFTANAATQFNLDGSTLTPGGKVVYHGTTISMAPGASDVVIDGQKKQLAAPAITPAPLLTIDGTVYRANRGSTYNIGGHMLTPNGAVTFSGTTISLPVDASNLIVNGLARPIGQAGPNVDDMATITAPPVLTVGGQAFAANGASHYLIHGQTLAPGGSIFFSGPRGMETVSLNAAARELVIVANGVTATSRVGIIGVGPSGAPVLTIDGNEYTAVAFGPGVGATYVLDSQTLVPGGLITIMGYDGPETISLLPAGTAVVSIHSGTTTTSQISGAYGVAQTQAPILTIGDETFTAINNGATYVIDGGDTLTPGGTDTVVIDGKAFVVTLSRHATMLEIQMIGQNGEVTSTIFETLFPATMTGPTIYNTQFAEATAGASATDGGASPTPASNPDLTNAASSSRALERAGGLIALGSFALAIWL